MIPLKNKAKLFMRYSVDRDDIPSGKKTRATIKALFMVTPISSTQSSITTVLNVDLNGKIPGFLINKITDMQLEESQNMKKVLESN